VTLPPCLERQTASLSGAILQEEIVMKTAIGIMVSLCLLVVDAYWTSRRALGENRDRAKC